MFKYPKLFLMLASFVFAYALSHQGYFDFLDGLGSFGYVSIFIAGFLFSVGFTTPFAIAVFIELAPFVSPVPAALLAGCGAVLMDFSIFELIRYTTFHDEFHRLRETRVIAHIEKIFHHRALSDKVREYLLWCLAGIVIASPLPDELGVMLVSGISDIDSKRFGILCFVFNSLGVLLILLAAR